LVINVMNTKLAKWDRYTEGWLGSSYYRNLDEGWIDRTKYLKAFSARSKRLLDVGCGSWELVGIKNDANTVGLDLSKTALLSNRKLGFIGDLILADCRFIPFRDGSFDHIICSEVIEHMSTLEDVIKLIDETKRIAKNILITTPNCALRYKIRDPTHHFFFTLNDLKRIMPNFRFYTSNIPPKRIIQRYLPYDSPKLQRFPLIGRLIVNLFKTIDSSKLTSFLSFKIWRGMQIVAIKLVASAESDILT